MAIMAILAGLAAPSFAALIERWQIQQSSQELQSTLQFARSEAIKLGGGVTITPSTGLADCTASDNDPSLWNCGWSVFVDANNNNSQDSNEVTLQLIAPTTAQIQLTDNDNNALSSPIAVDRWGQLTHSNTNQFAFRLAPTGDAPAETNALTLCISSTGHIKKLSSATANCT